MQKKQILVLGSIAYDYIMQFEGDFNDYLITDRAKKVFNIAVMPSSKTINFGGTSGNISYNLAQINGSTVVITAVGKDFKDLGYEQHLIQYPNIKFAGVVYNNLYTASCYIVNDKNHNQMIIFHQGAMENCPKIKLKEKGISKDTIKIATVSPDNYLAMVNWARELDALGIPFILDPGPVTPAFITEVLQEVVPKAKLLIGNEYEISMIQDKLKVDLDGLLKLNPTLVTTRGVKGSVLYDNGQTHEIPIVPPEKFMDPTGAGDGYRAGLLCGLANDLKLVDACRLGAVISSFVVETIGPQTQQYSLETVKKRFAEMFGKNLDI